MTEPFESAALGACREQFEKPTGMLALRLALGIALDKIAELEVENAKLAASLLENQAEVTRRTSDDREIVAMICDNPEGPPHSLIGIWGDWVGPNSYYQKRSFMCESLLDCLRKAVVAKSDGNL